MSLKKFNQTTYEAFKKIDLQSIQIKSVLINSCSDTDRYLRLFADINIFQKVNENEFSKIKELFPNFKQLDLDQFNELLKLFVAIRDVSAHLFLNKPISITETTKLFIKRIIDPEFELSSNGHITLFGAIVVVTLFCQRYQLKDIVHGIVKHTILSNVKKEGLGNYQSQFNRKLIPLCGIGGAVYSQDNSYVRPKESHLFIDSVRRTLTKLFFEIERKSPGSFGVSNNVPSFVTYINKYSFVKNDKEFIDDMVELRNYWLHGCYLFDTVSLYHEGFVFDLEYLFGMLYEIKIKFDVNGEYNTILNIIDDCGSNMINFFTLRSIEVSYKLLDKRVSDIDKMRERITNSINAYSHIFSTPENYYNQAYSLLNNGIKTWYLIGSKFLDFRERRLTRKRLAVYEFSSEKGFDIGEHHYDCPEMVVTDIELEEEFQNKINGKYLKEYKTTPDSTYGFIDIYSVNL